MLALLGDEDKDMDWEDPITLFETSVNQNALL